MLYCNCLCGRVRFEITESPFSFSFCYCEMCRRSTGGPFGAYVGVMKNQLNTIAGKNYIKAYDSSEWASRTFCCEYGSTLTYKKHELPDKIFLAAGIFNGKLDILPQRHIFVKDKCCWFNICDDLPQLEAL